MSQIVKVKAKVKAIGLFKEIAERHGFMTGKGNRFSNGIAWVEVAKDGSVSGDYVTAEAINKMIVDYVKAAIRIEASRKGLSVIESKGTDGKIHIKLR